MDKAALVKRDVEIEGLITTALSRQKVPVSLCEWYYVPELDEWQLIVATPLYDQVGPHNANARVVTALQDEGVYQEIPVRRIFVKSPEDTVVKALLREARVLTEGNIHIVNYSRASHDPYYSMTFMPFAGPGGAIPPKYFVSSEDLRTFLEGRVHVHRSAVDEALAELKRKGSSSISNVQLTMREVRKLGLA